MSRASLSSRFVWQYSGSLAANASLTSGAIDTTGFSSLKGLVFSSCTLSSGCGVYFQQSADGGTNWDYANACSLAAGSGSLLGVDIYGKAIRVSIYNGAAAASSVRAYFELKQT
jgi:hypothetical protein